MNHRRLLEILREHFNPRAPGPGESKHAGGCRAPKNYRARLKAKRKAQRNARKQARRQKKGRKHRK